MTQATGPSHHAPVKPRWGFEDYFWFILKNIVGWTLVLGSLVVGPAIPGPGGLPMFFMGFAMVTFPGKRRLTARVFRGIPVDRWSRGYRITVGTVAVLVPAIVIAFFAGRWWIALADLHTPRALWFGTLYGCFVALLWIFGLRGVHLINLFLRGVPKARRHVRPWLRAKGIDLLPPRRRGRLAHHGQQEPDEEIVEIHKRHRERLARLWACAKPWIIRLVRLVVICGIFVWMLKPIVRNWHVPEVRNHILRTNWWNFAAASLMFSVFLFAFRAMAWRYILAGLGHRLPVAPATRIWSFSELARYLPGVIWQVVGRVILSRPYGVSASISSASQLLELAVFMLANILVAIVCLVLVGLRWLPWDKLHWVFIALAFVPALLLLLHPRIFYGLLNALLRRLKKPVITQTLPKRALAVVLLWNVLGLLWQSLAVWILTYSVLGLPLAKWYVLAGAYCLAWTIGFSVGFLSPGGMGVREAVFITTMQIILPQQWVAEHLHYANRQTFEIFLRFLGVLLRLWAMCGELVMASLAFTCDYRGTMNRADAPGRPPADAAAERPLV